MSDAEFEQLVGPYLAKELDPELSARIRAYLEQTPERQGFVAGIRAAIRSEHVAAAPDLEAARQRLLAMLAREQAADVTPAVVRERHASRTGRDRTANGLRSRVFATKTVGYAVAALATVVVSVLAGWAVGSNTRSHRATVNGSANGSAYTRYATAKGQRATITLPDGSTVVLNVDSRLEVPVDYATGHRALRLVGEALFRVRAHGTDPFTVSAGGETARVLGTSFAVRRYATDSAMTVAVRDGKVSVRTAVLTAGKQVVVGQAGLQVESADTSNFAFAAGVLVLDDRPFPDVVAELDRWFDADVQLGSDALARRRISVTFGPGSVADLVSVLQLMDLRVVREGRRVTLFPTR